MKTFALGPCVLALAVSAGMGIARAAPLPLPPSFSAPPWELPSLGLKQAPSTQTPSYTPHVFEGIPQRSLIARSSPIDRMPIAEPKPGIDYKLIVKAPDPKINYKMLLSETEPRQVAKPQPK